MLPATKWIAVLHLSFQILSLILTPISQEDTIEIFLTSRKCCLVKLWKVDAWNQALLLWKKLVFLIGFSLTFPRFPPKSKNQLHSSLYVIQNTVVQLGIVLCFHWLLPLMLETRLEFWFLLGKIGYKIIANGKMNWRIMFILFV